jgi:hypothetical protein
MKIRNTSLDVEVLGQGPPLVLIPGDAELTAVCAMDHLDTLTREYTRHPAYKGHIYPAEQQARETRVIYRIHARRITLDAIHA